MRENAIPIDKLKREKSETVCIPLNIAVVAESVREGPSTWIHGRSQELNIIEANFAQIGGSYLNEISLHY